jgi:hypothetical protein
LHVLLLLRGRRRHDPVLRWHQRGHGSGRRRSSNGTRRRTSSHGWTHRLGLSVLRLICCGRWWRWLSRSGSRRLGASWRRWNSCSLSPLGWRRELPGLLVWLLIPHRRLRGYDRRLTFREGRHDRLGLAGCTSCPLGLHRRSVVPSWNVPSLCSRDRSWRVVLPGSSHWRRCNRTS